MPVDPSFVQQYDEIMQDPYAEWARKNGRFSEYIRSKTIRRELVNIARWIDSERLGPAQQAQRAARDTKESYDKRRIDGSVTIGRIIRRAVSAAIDDLGKQGEVDDKFTILQLQSHIYNNSFRCEREYGLLVELIDDSRYQEYLQDLCDHVLSSHESSWGSLEVYQRNPKGFRRDMRRHEQEMRYSTALLTLLANKGVYPGGELMIKSTPLPSSVAAHMLSAKSRPPRPPQQEQRRGKLWKRLFRGESP